jgi:hypothetical protein
MTVKTSTKKPKTGVAKADEAADDLTAQLFSTDPKIVRATLVQVDPRALTGRRLAQVVAVALFSEDAAVRKEGLALLLAHAPDPLRQRLQGDKRRYVTIADESKIRKLAKELSGCGVDPAAFTLAILRVYATRPQSYGGITEPALVAALSIPGRDEEVFEQLADQADVYLLFKKTCPKGLSRLRSLRKLRMFQRVEPGDTNFLELARLPQPFVLEYWGPEADLAVVARLAPALGGLALRGRTSKVSSIAPLAACPHLHTLDLADTEVSDLTPLVGLPLTNVCLDDTPVSSLEPLRGMTSITRLSLRHVRGDLRALETMTGMVALTLRGSSIPDLRALGPMTRLERVDLQGTQAADLSPLAGKPLEVIDLDDVTGEVDIRPVADVPGLRVLSLRRCRVDPAQVTALQARMPDLHIFVS